MAVYFNSPELRELSSTDLKFLEEGLDGGGLSFCDLDGILDVFKADTHVLLTNPDSLLQGMCPFLFPLPNESNVKSVQSGQIVRLRQI